MTSRYETWTKDSCLPHALTSSLPRDREFVVPPARWTYSSRTAGRRGLSIKGSSFVQLDEIANHSSSSLRTTIKLYPRDEVHRPSPCFRALFLHLGFWSSRLERQEPRQAHHGCCSRHRSESAEAHA
ncbi:hypothetical protein MPH_08483 [Macrophomina phaseolina MS6]|uniref:Uncharacterized protein n=1 Tax=Macrophomina phaseolina (strain MS6) TaxID=1126212 RepID=K2RI62_MACPH|nr:hypothetical protein MPH_08483 [Macrophomina phaseolina MS6]